MNSIGERISELIKTLGITKTVFSNRINVSQAFVSMVCSGSSAASDRTIADICREFRVNEEWLRTGAGEMFIQATRSQLIADFMSDVLAEAPDGPRNVVVSALAQLDADDWQAIAEILRKFRTNP